MKGSEFVLDYVHLLYYKCHKINLQRGSSYRFSLLDEKINKKSIKKIINPFNMLQKLH